MENKETFVIIDANSIIHRAFHALPPLKSKDGQVVNAVYGFLLVLFKLLKEIEPKYFVACFDVPKPTFRKKMFEEYKAQRKKAPDELYIQIPIVKEVLKTFNVPVFEKEGYEGDDLIGTLSFNVKDKLNIIVSGDKDNLQLINNNTRVYYLNQGVKSAIMYDEVMVKEKYGGLIPNQLIDYKGLRGDASDNIPGVKGIGEKTGLVLIRDFGSIDNLYDKIGKGEDNLPKKLKEKLIDQKKEAYLSRELSEIRKDVPIEINLKDCEWGGYDNKEVLEMLKQLNFNSLIKNIDPDRTGENLRLW
ncbi:MAG: 5'-3' exonuclease H3TH domain-containing protein [Candidatus Pacebacteria bacterium]|nr:5'-3' exonuclease H3TH domain-containing protein [Candidatus Paceibacterota bacterium]MDD2757128.1 5'-3' exonuclease H3TH domain-containing protein [Candidatus Paceibacterota bacterium]MDD3283601.1 5'-3' exonuclease H3TH domain-containing protein [Candidatus Paceibacterota bacterium]MDD3969776.1 5'-3' exonuclease H3TH domain-containing protein [Candidatus Paceibacterota bacterium]MDD4737986.1 5'-3' exonuclease H3TH domain-containing protein [Candidatus Paceibacterota bacterium]